MLAYDGFPGKNGLTKLWSFVFPSFCLYSLPFFFKYCYETKGTSSIFVEPDLGSETFDNENKL